MTRFSSRNLALGLFAGVVGFGLAACSSSAQPTWTYGPAAAVGDAGGASTQASSAQGSAAQGSTVSTTGAMSMSGMAMTPARPAANAAIVSGTGSARLASTRLDITIVTGDMIGKTEYPAFVPADFTLPANSTVTVTITNFDDATALPKGAESYATASGVVGGTFTVSPINLKDPNSATAAAKTLSSLDPADVSHTLTIPGLGINVPIAAHARETFTITTGAPGTFTWHCMDPCGAGDTGWGTAMAARKGYMEGTLTVA